MLPAVALLARLISSIEYGRVMLNGKHSAWGPMPVDPSSCTVVTRAKDIGMNADVW
jgi:hypothetical protein